MVSRSASLGVPAGDTTGLCAVPQRVGWHEVPCSLAIQNGSPREDTLGPQAAQEQ